MNPKNDNPVRVLQVEVDSGRLDKYLAAALPELSRSLIQKLIAAGEITVNGKPAKSHQDLKAGDTLNVIMPPETPLTPQAEAIPLDIVYRDRDIVVVNKQAGLTMHPAGGHATSTLVNALLSVYSRLGNSGEPMRPGIVHRLDRDTSGLTVIARTNKALENLKKQFKDRTVKKYYLALVKGKLTPETGVIDAPIDRHPVNRKKMAVVEGGREARTRYRVIKYYKNDTLVEAMLETGRTHQIRVHFAAIGYPVIGDPVYGIRTPLLKRQFLHAYKLGINLPSTGEYKEFTAGLPEDLQSYLDKLN
jgi:23S rRNA pseudouridine1911/1915/1917 synthase